MDKKNGEEANIEEITKRSDTQLISNKWIHNSQ